MILRNLSEPEVGKVLFDQLPGRDQRADHPRERHVAHRGHIRLRDTRPFRTDHAAISPAKKSVFNQDRRRSERRRLGTGLCRVPGRRTRRAGVRQELHGGRLQDRLRQGRWRAIDLHARFHRPHHRRRTSGSSKPRAARNWIVPQKMARLRQWCADATRSAARMMADALTVSSTWIRRALSGTSRRRSRRLAASVQRISGGLRMARHREKILRLERRRKAGPHQPDPAGKPLPEKYRFMLFEDKREVELVWNGKDARRLHDRAAVSDAWSTSTSRARKQRHRASCSISRGRQLQGLDEQTDLGRQQADPCPR